MSMLGSAIHRAKFHLEWRTSSLWFSALNCQITAGRKRQFAGVVWQSHLLRRSDVDVLAPSRQLASAKSTVGAVDTS
jgi:hypothetical protein